MTTFRLFLSVLLLAPLPLWYWPIGILSLYLVWKSIDLLYRKHTIQ